MDSNQEPPHSLVQTLTGYITVNQSQLKDCKFYKVQEKLQNKTLKKILQIQSAI